MNRPNKNDYPMCQTDYYLKGYYEDLEKYCDELEAKQEKYKWHDLRKNPDDLPEKESFFKNLLCVDQYGILLTDCDLHYSEECGFFESESDGVFLTNVVRWKYIEEVEDESL